MSYFLRTAWICVGNECSKKKVVFPFFDIILGVLGEEEQSYAINVTHLGKTPIK